MRHGVKGDNSSLLTGHWVVPKLPVPHCLRSGEGSPDTWMLAFYAHACHGSALLATKPQHFSETPGFCEVRSRHPQGNSGGEHLTAPVPLQGRGAAKESTEKGLWKHWLGAVWSGGLLSQLSWPRKPGTQIALYLERASEIPREPGKTSLTFGCRERSSLSGCWPALATKHSEVPVGSQCPAPTQKPGSTGSPPSAQADILASS